MFNVRLAGGHLYGKQLFTWLSLAVSLMASFVLSFFSLDVLDEIWDLIESVSEGFLTYSLTLTYVMEPVPTQFYWKMSIIVGHGISRSALKETNSQTDLILSQFVFKIVCF